MLREKLLAWGVHIFTASGLLAGFLAIRAIGLNDWRAAMAWLIVALFIDGVDGTLARNFRVKEVLPRVNGKVIDTVVDFTNYAVVPAYFFYAAELAGPVFSLPLAFVILLVSAIYYGKDGMVSDDFYFIGFPVMWNVVIFYLVFVFSSAPLPHCPLSIVNCPLAPAVVIIFAILHFVPIKFAYPSRATRHKRLSLVATALMFLIMPLAVWLYPPVPIWLKWLAIINLCVFGALAAIDTLRKT